MRTFLLTLLVVLLACVDAYASDDSELVGRTIRVYEQIESVRSQMDEAVGGLSDEKRAYELALYEFEGEPKTAEQLQELAGDIEKQKQNLKQLESRNGSASAVAYCKRRIRDLSLIYQANRATTEAERQAFRDKAEPKIDQMAEKIAVLEAPYREQIKALETKAKQDNEALSGLLRKYFKTPEQAFPGSTVNHFNATASMAFGACHWQDGESRQIAWTHVRVRSLDEVQDYHRENLLDGKYPIQSLSDNSLWVWAGHFLVTFVADDETLHGQDNIRQAIHGFVDLEGLASIESAYGKVASGSSDE